MLVLGIDTSCDDTGIGLVRDGTVVANAIATQHSHATFGGVVPEVASREHLHNIQPTLHAALLEAGATLQDITHIAATRGPGLAGTLLVGFQFAKALAFAQDLPFYAIHHLQGHIQAALVAAPDMTPPYLALIVSGGHTHLFDCQKNTTTLIGATRDDAAGEAFDKVARLLELGFPGGPAIANAALHGNPTAHSFTTPLQGQTGYDFSFSGLKNAARLAAQTLETGATYTREDLAASFQNAVVTSLVRTTERAAKDLGHNAIVVSGGVAANAALRQAFLHKAKQHAWRVVFPPAGLNTDNGAMIALAGHYRAQRQEASDALTLEVRPYWSLVEES